MKVEVRRSERRYVARESEMRQEEERVNGGIKV